MSSVPIGLLERRVGDALRGLPLGHQSTAWARHARHKAEAPASYLDATKDRGGARRAEERAERA